MTQQIEDLQQRMLQIINEVSCLKDEIEGIKAYIADLETWQEEDDLPY